VARTDQVLQGQLFELEDFAPMESIERFREIGLATNK
jgi:hypothetical protein